MCFTQHTDSRSTSHLHETQSHRELCHTKQGLYIAQNVSNKSISYASCHNLRDRAGNREECVTCLEYFSHLKYKTRHAAAQHFHFTVKRLLHGRCPSKGFAADIIAHGKACLDSEDSRKLYFQVQPSLNGPFSSHRSWLTDKPSLAACSYHLITRMTDIHTLSPVFL